MHTHVHTHTHSQILFHLNSVAGVQSTPQTTGGFIPPTHITSVSGDVARSTTPTTYPPYPQASAPYPNSTTYGPSPTYPNPTTYGTSAPNPIPTTYGLPAPNPNPTAYGLSAANTSQAPNGTSTTYPNPPTYGPSAPNTNPPSYEDAMATYKSGP